MQLIEKSHYFDKIDKLDFDIFEFTKEIGRAATLPYCVLGMMSKANLNLENANINEEKLVEFLNKIARGYRTEVQYHNDLHGADVA